MKIQANLGRVMVVVLGIALSFVSCGERRRAESYTPQESGTLASLLERDKSLSLSEELCSMLKLDKDEAATRLQKDDFTRLQLASSTSLTFQRTTGRLISFIASERGISRPPASAVAIDNAGAIRMAAEFASLVGIDDTDFSDALVEEESSGIRALDYDTRRYIVRVRRPYNGFASPSEFRFTVRAATGEIAAFRDVPFVPPSSLVQHIAQTQAEHIAREFAEGRGIALGSKASSKLAIVYPNNEWTRSERELPSGDLGATRLCWVIRFEKDYPACGSTCVYVDTESGEVVGGVR